MRTIEVPPLIPEIGVPFQDTDTFVDLMERATAACNTAMLLGLDTAPTQEDEDIAATLVEAYANSPEEASKAVTEHRAAALRAPSLILTKCILDEFGKQVVEHSVHIRHLVTNKLILLSEDGDKRIQLRALENLGKISDVGLFVEKIEKTVTYQSSDDLRNRLKEKLHRMVNPDEDVIDGEVIEYE